MKASWFGHQYEEYPFELFSLSHLVMLFLLIAGVLMFYCFRYPLRRRSAFFRYTFFLLFILLEFFYHYWMIKGGYWDTASMLPLQLCSLSLLLCIILLVTMSERLFQIVYFIGITGACMAIFTPELFLGFPHFRYFHFFVTHILIIWTCLYFVFVHGYKPTQKGMLLSFGFLNGSALVAFLVNVWTGGNYMFLSYKPVNGSLLDYLGPYPHYIFALEGMAIFLFYILLVPFKGKKEMKEGRRRDKPS